MNYNLICFVYQSLFYEFQVFMLAPINTDPDCQALICGGSGVAEL